MSIHLQAGYFFEINEVLSPDSLNAMLGDAVATGMVSGDLQAGYVLIDTAVTAPTATLGYPWLDFGLTLPGTTSSVIRYNDGATYSLPYGILQLTYTGTDALGKGQIVSLRDQGRVIKTGQTGGSVALTTDRAPFAVALGPTLTTGQMGLFCWRGIAQVLIDDVFNVSFGTASLMNYHVHARGSNSPGNARIVVPEDVLAGNNLERFATMLEDTTNDTFVPGLFYCKVWK